MANGPLGGFMPTPPSPGQPPQVKLETSAESRGAFNKFLGTLPSNGAIAPIQTGVDVSSTTPVSPVTSNVNIFQPQMSQMAPMPMMPPAQPVQMMQDGGFVDDTVGDTSAGQFDDYDFGGSTDFSVTESDLAGGTFDDGGGGISFTDDTAGGQDIVTGLSTQTPTEVDTRPVTNIRNVGPTSNLRFDPNFALRSFSRSTGTPVEELLDQGYGERFGIGQPQVGTSVVPANLSTGLKTLANTTQQNQFVDPTEGIAPVTRRSGVTGTGQTGPVDLLGLGDLGFGGLGLGRPNELQELRSINRDLTNKLSDLQPEVNPASIPLAPAPNLTAVDRNLTGISGIGADLSSPQSRDVLDNQFTQIAGLPTVVPGARGGLPDADPLAGDVIGAIRSGAAGLPFTNNPGALKQGQPDLTTEVVKSLPTGSRLTQDNLAPAIFNTLDAGIKSIDRQLGLYANNPSANITTPAALANTYLGSGNKENSPANRAAYIDAIKAVAGESFDLNNPTTRSNISQAIVNQEFGQAGRDVMAEMRRGTDVSILDNLNLDQLRLNEPLRSNVNQLATLDPIQPPIDQGIIPVGEFDVRDRPLTQEEFDRQRNFLVRDARDFLNARRIPGIGFDSRDVPIETNRQRIDREQKAIQDRGGRPTFAGQFGINPVTGQRLPGVDIRGPLAARLASVLPDQALETLEGRRDRQLRDQVFDIDTTSIQPFSQSAQVQELLNRGARAQEISDIQKALDRGTVAEDLDRPISFVDSDPVADSTATTDLTRGPDVSVVGSDVVPSLEVRDIVGDVTQERVADILNRPDRFKETFTIGDAEFPNLIATLANKAGTFFDRRLFDGIVKKGLDAVVDPDTGRIIGAKDEFGNLIEGRDLEQFQPDDGGGDPVTKFLRKATEDKREEDKDDQPPNQIGDVVIRDPEPPKPTVVKSTAPASTASFTPVGFDAGNLNDLIARITGVPTPRRLQDGGQVQAVDRFLSKVA